MTQPVVVIGGGGMGRCVLDLIGAINSESIDTGAPEIEVVGVCDDGQPDEDLLTARGVAFLGPLSALDDMTHDVGYVIGIGSPAAKRQIDDVLARTGRPSPVLVHPNVHRGFDVTLDPGVIVCSHVSMENHIRLGRHVHVNQNSTVGHDTVVGDYCTISPLVAVSGNVRMEDSVFIGSGASIRQGITVHRDATVAMGAAVVKDVGGGTTVLGVPAVPLAGSG